MFFPVQSHRRLPDQRSPSAPRHTDYRARRSDPASLPWGFSHRSSAPAGRSADHLIQGADAQTGHVFPQFLRDKPHKVHPHIPVCPQSVSEAPGSGWPRPPGRYPGCRHASSHSPWSRGAPVAKPNSSAPRSAAMATSRPLISLPSVSIMTRLRSPFRRSV